MEDEEGVGSLLPHLEWRVHPPNFVVGIDVQIWASTKIKDSHIDEQAKYVYKSNLDNNKQDSLLLFEGALQKCTSLDYDMFHLLTFIFINPSQTRKCAK